MTVLCSFRPPPDQQRALSDQPRALSIKHGRFLIKHGPHLIKHGRFLIKHGRFPIKHGRFPINHGRFLIKHGRFPGGATSPADLDAPRCQALASALNTLYQAYSGRVGAPVVS